MKSFLINNFILLFLFSANNNLRLRGAVSEPVKAQTVVAPLQINNQIGNCIALRSIKNKIHRADSSLVLIKVLHIGDSHVKAGFFSQALMEKLNAFYANKFRGHLFFNFQKFCKVGTKYSDYTELAELDNQLIREKPDLVIISLGTNDAFSGSSKKNFYEKIDHLVKKINSLSPQAIILLTTPSDALKKNSSNAFTTLPELQHVVDVIIKYANDHNLAYWNLHQIMGGSYSINNWYLKKLSEPDRIHFNGKGYTLLADWLSLALTACLENNISTSNNFHL